MFCAFFYTFRYKHSGKAVCIHVRTRGFKSEEYKYEITLLVDRVDIDQSRRYFEVATGIEVFWLIY